MKKSDNQYPSKYSNGKTVSAAQYITELICENKARIDGVDLHFRFWDSPKWAKFFRDQIASAHKLLKKYEIVPIIRALKSTQGSRIYSLRAPHLPRIIETETKKYDNAKESEPKIVRVENPVIKQNSISNKKNIISILKDLENGN